jgi:hypothetical protein
MYFGMSLSDTYLAATVNAAAVAKHHGVKAFINMSQMTLAQMSVTETTPSPQHKLQWLAEQALNWSGLPVVHVRPIPPTRPAAPVTRMGVAISLPFTRLNQSPEPTSPADGPLSRGHTPRVPG